jgi:hypothetical protein
MSSLSKNGLVRKSGTALISVTVLGALLLTGCAPSGSNETKAQPTESASATPTPTSTVKGITSFVSEAFDLEKQVSINVPEAKSNSNGQSNILLAGGVVVKSVSEDGKVTVSYTPYESDKGWEYTTENSFDGDTGASLMRWKGKSYIVIDGWNTSSEAAKGLTAEKKSSVQLAIILDAVTGEEVNTVSIAESGKNGDTFALDNTPMSVSSQHYKVPAPFMTGLVYRTVTGQVKLVDPVTGETVATDDRRNKPTNLNSESGFYSLDTLFMKDIAASFGNYALTASRLPVVKGAAGGSFPASKYALMNAATKTVVSEIECLDLTVEPEVTYSPDFRFVNFMGTYVFDTQTGDAFCSAPVGKEDVRRFSVTSVDNSGNMYGTADNDYLKVSLADNSKVETLIANNKNALPLLITDKGSALFRSEQSEDVLVAIPAKG